MAKPGTLYIDAQFTHTDKSIMSLSQPGFDVRLFGSSFDQLSRNIELNEIEIDNLKTRVNNVSATQRSSQLEVNVGTNDDKFITSVTFQNSDTISSLLEYDLHEKFEAIAASSNNQNGNYKTLTKTYLGFIHVQTS